MACEDAFKHFLERAKERYDLDLTLEDLKEIAEAIKLGNAKLIRADSRGFAYKVRHKSTLLAVVTNRSHSALVTALPLNKQTERVNFSNQHFYYLDAMRINWLFRKHFKVDKIGHVVCPKCGSQEIKVDLGKNRFKCCKCYNIVKYKKQRQPDIVMNVVKDNKFVPSLRLSIDLWWYLYDNESSVIYENLEITPVVLDNDRLEYSIKYKDTEFYVPRGLYLVDNLKETNNGQ